MKTIKEKLEIIQKEIFKKASKKKVFGVFSKVGSGKTKIASDLINKRIIENKIDNVFWVTLKVLLDQTKQEIIKWYPKLINKITFINIEKLSLIDINKIDSFCQINNINEKTYLILDESLKIKNSNSKRTKFLLELSKKVKYKLILNGTPISKNILDLYTQISFLDQRILNYKNEQEFINNHFEYYKFLPWNILEIHNLEYSQFRIKDFIYDNSFIDNFSNIQKIEVIHNDKTILSQEEKWKSLLNKINKRETFFNDNLMLGNFSKLFIATEKTIYKLESLKQIIKSYPKKQIIIMCRFVENIYLLKEYFQEKAIIYYGKQKDDLDLFKNQEVQFLIMGLRVGSFGINGLQKNCHIMIFYDNPLSIDEIIQAKGRIYRFGQIKECLFFQLIIKDSIINEIITNILNKKNNNLLDISNWTKGNYE